MSHSCWHRGQRTKSKSSTNNFTKQQQCWLTWKKASASCADRTSGISKGQLATLPVEGLPILTSDFFDERNGGLLTPGAPEAPGGSEKPGPPWGPLNVFVLSSTTAASIPSARFPIDGPSGGVAGPIWRVSDAGSTRRCSLQAILRLPFWHSTAERHENKGNQGALSLSFDGSCRQSRTRDEGHWSR